VAYSHGCDESRNRLSFHCADEGKKLAYLKVNSKVWGQSVLDHGVTDEWDYAHTNVYLRGKVRLIEDKSKKQHTIEVLIWQLSENPEKKKTQIKPGKLVKPTMGRIDLNYMSDKRHQDSKL
jgi:nitroimidazol reductase NimA-like FMN-containing flavoprotein (pyridoxamine 5'-phosphate oxidase superfamily)